MPTSSHDKIVDWINVIFNFRHEIASMLDIGVGFGKYGVLAREFIDIWGGNYTPGEWQTRIEGIEIFKKYRSPIHDYVYDKIYYGDVRSLLPNLGVYDVISFVDVIEHFYKEEGVSLLDECLRHATRFIYVCHPDGTREDALNQGAAFENLAERYLARWTPKDFEKYPYKISISPKQTFVCTNKFDQERIRQIIEGDVPGLSNSFPISILTKKPVNNQSLHYDQSHRTFIQKIKDSKHNAIQLARRLKEIIGYARSPRMFMQKIFEKIEDTKNDTIQFAKRSKIKLFPKIKYKGVGGPKTRSELLQSGLRQVHQKHFWNPDIEEVTEYVHVLINADALRWAIEQKRLGKIKYLIAGPTVVRLPHAHDGLIVAPEVDLILFASEWIRDWFIEMDSSVKGRTAIWPAGVDVKNWYPSSTRKWKYDFVIIDKIYAWFWSAELPVEHETLSQEVRKILREGQYKFKTLKYGHYTPEQYRQALHDSRSMIYLSRQETQGIALSEAWACNVPTLTWSSGLAGSMGLYYDKASTCPYGVEKTGMTFRDISDFKEKLPVFYKKLMKNEFAPRSYVASELSLQASTKRYLEIWKKIELK